VSKDDGNRAQEDSANSKKKSQPTDNKQNSEAVTLPETDRKQLEAYIKAQQFSSETKTKPISVPADVTRLRSTGVCLVPLAPNDPYVDRPPSPHVKYLEDYINTLKRMGVPHFQLAHTTPFLIGVGIVGELDGVARSTRDTRTREVFIEDLEADANQTPALAGRVWALIDTKNAMTPPGISIGRSAINDVVISEYALSKSHCRFNIAKNQKDYVVEDLESTNGTLLNGERLKPNEQVAIKHFDVLVLGRFQFQFCTSRGFIKELIDRAKVSTF